MNFGNKVVLITGASSGIGYELAKQLSGENCKLALLARRIENLEKLAAEIETAGGNAFPFKCDVTDRQNVLDCFREVKKKLGSIDIALLNAGTSSRESVKSFNSSSAERIFGVNVLGMIYGVEALLPIFIEKNRGMLIGVSSLADARGFSKSGFYSASKAAATIFLESMRIELKDYGVKVLTVKPGFVKTPMTDKNEFTMPFLMNTEKAAKIIIKGIKKEKRIIQFPLPTVLGAKLLKLMPDSLFEAIARKQMKLAEKN